MKRALITGVTGQDGYYLSDFLQKQGYEVYGLVRRTAQPAVVPEGVKAIEGDVTDLHSVRAAIRFCFPGEVYNLAAQSHVATSFACPMQTFETNAKGAWNVFEACRGDGGDAIRVYQAGTSEMFGGLERAAYSETSRFHPRSPYAIAKVAAHHTAVHYRETYGMHISNGILFNHESPKRGLNFLPRKVINHVAKVKLGLTNERLLLGAPWPRRDWGYAADYVRAMWLMLQQPKGDDYVVGTGDTASVRDFVEMAYEAAGLDYTNPETGASFGTDRRPAEVPTLKADAEKARRVLNWQPTVYLEGLIRLMLEAELDALRLKTNVS